MANKSPRELFEDKVYISPKGVLCQYNEGKTNSPCASSHLEASVIIKCYNCGSPERMCSICCDDLRKIHVCKYCNSGYYYALRRDGNVDFLFFIAVVFVCVGIAAAFMICMKFEEHGSIIHNKVVWKDKGHIKASPAFNELESRISELETYIKAQADRNQIPTMAHMIDSIKSNPAPLFLAISLFYNVASIAVSLYVVNFKTYFTTAMSLMLNVCLFFIFYGPKN